VRKPRVALGLPVYNGERYLPKALDSVLAQDFEDFQLVISDNASTDGTQDVCMEYARRDSRIRYFRNATNLGIAPNFQRVFHLSDAPYFKWVVHDDVCGPGFLRECVNLLDEAPASVVLVYPRAVQIDEGGNTLGPYDDDLDAREAKPSQRLERVLRHYGLCYAALGLHRSSALAKSGLIGGFESSDVVLLAELAMIGQFWRIPRYLYQARVHAETSFSQYRSKEKFDETMDVANRGRYVMPRTRQFLEIRRAISRLELRPVERIQCVACLLRVWGPRFWRVLGGEWKQLCIDLALGKAHIESASGGLTLRRAVDGDRDRTVLGRRWGDRSQRGDAQDVLDASSRTPNRSVDHEQPVPKFENKQRIEDT
jgi:glycosyltransferase involved in cell wall biosynthesis